MAQTIVHVTITGDKYTAEKFFSFLPDIEEVEDIVEEEELGTDFVTEYEKYIVGEGEAGMDEFFSEEELEAFYEKDGTLVHGIEENGYSWDVYEHGVI